MNREIVGYGEALGYGKAGEKIDRRTRGSDRHHFLHQTMFLFFGKTRFHSYAIPYAVIRLKRLKRPGAFVHALSHTLILRPILSPVSTNSQALSGDRLPRTCICKDKTLDPSRPLERKQHTAIQESGALSYNLHHTGDPPSKPIKQHLKFKALKIAA